MCRKFKKLLNEASALLFIEKNSQFKLFKIILLQTGKKDILNKKIKCINYNKIHLINNNNINLMINKIYLLVDIFIFAKN